MTSQIFPTSSDCVIASTRIVNASPATVYRAWTDPDHLKSWWGPAGFTNTFHEFDLRPGGKWRFIMHGPDKGNYPNECEFIQIVEPSLITWKRISKPLFKVMVTFDEVVTGKTKIVFRMIFDTAGECNKVKPFAADKNEENFDRLEMELLSMTK